MKATKDDWVKMEERAAAGVGGVLHENFKPSVLIMDEASDNSSSPVMVVNGECTCYMFMHVHDCIITCTCMYVCMY